MTFKQKSDEKFVSPRAVHIYTYCKNTKIQVFWNVTLCLTKDLQTFRKKYLH